MGCEIDIDWDKVVGSLDTFTLYKDGVLLDTGITYPPFVDLTSNDQSTHSYYLIASNPPLEDSASSSVVFAHAIKCPIVLPPEEPLVIEEPISSKTVCTASQDNGADKNLYYGRNTTWTMTNNVVGTTTTVGPVTWTGTNIVKTITTGSTFNKTYPLIPEPKTINGIGTIKLPSGKSFISTCNATATMQEDTGTNGEI